MGSESGAGGVSVEEDVILDVVFAARQSANGLLHGADTWRVLYRMRIIEDSFRFRRSSERKTVD